VNWLTQAAQEQALSAGLTPGSWGPVLQRCTYFLMARYSTPRFSAFW